MINRSCQSRVTDRRRRCLGCLICPSRSYRIQRRESGRMMVTKGMRAEALSQHGDRVMVAMFLVVVVAAAPHETLLPFCGFTAPLRRITVSRFVRVSRCWRTRLPRGRGICGVFVDSIGPHSLLLHNRNLLSYYLYSPSQHRVSSRALLQYLSSTVYQLHTRNFLAH